MGEKKSHAATMSELHTKTRSIKELILQSEEDRKNIIILQESLDKLNEKIKMYKRELESSEARAEEAESTLNQFRSRERVFASAASRSEKSSDVQETEVVVKKIINKVNVSGGASSSMAISSSSSAEQSSSSALQSSRDMRAGSVYASSSSRAGSVARAGSTYRASSVRAGSMSRATSTLRY